MKKYHVFLFFTIIYFKQFLNAQDFDSCKIVYSGIVDIIQMAKKDSTNLLKYENDILKEFQKIQGIELIVSQDSSKIYFSTFSKPNEFIVLSQANRGIVPIFYYIKEGKIIFECKTLSNYKDGVALWTGGIEFFIIDDKTDFKAYDFYCWQNKRESKKKEEDKNKEPPATSTFNQKNKASTNTNNNSSTVKKSYTKYYTGPRGGCYYINSSGKKVYVDRSYCN